MKIFYRVVADAQMLLDEQSTSLEELYLPDSALHDFLLALEASRSLLPLTARNFKEWKVGLLDRYQSSPAATWDMDERYQELFTEQAENNHFENMFRRTMDLDIRSDPLYAGLFE